MDAKVGDWVVTPRIGKPVEIQCLWINALWIASKFNRDWKPDLKLAVQSFLDKFWNEELGCLLDIIDVSHQAGIVDAAVRSNQILAVGGLPYSFVKSKQAKAILATVESQLLTPLGLRSLSPDDPDYKPIYGGDVLQRDGAYHQGTVWPWMLGPFVEAWFKIHGSTKKTRAEAKALFLDPLEAHLNVAGEGHISEITDADSPHHPRGCPFQAWSLSAYIRIKTMIKGTT